MAFTLSVDRIDQNGRELLTYGSEDFPIAFFDDDLTSVSVPYHWHDEFEIVIITKGSVQVRIAGKEFKLTAGDGYFSNSGILHAETLITPTGHQHALVFSPKIISQCDDLIWKTYVLPVLENNQLPFLQLSSSVTWQKEILRLAETAWNSGGYETADYPLVVRSCLSKAISLISHHMGDLESEFHFTDRFRHDEERIKQALVFIESNYGESVTIDDIAKSANVSTSTCLRLFRTVLNTTPIAYLLVFRLQRALEELKQNDSRTISEIAYSCGFSDASYFNRRFRKEYGITPTEYISKHRIPD
jgi:AraC-like DNA-binding protein